MSIESNLYNFFYDKFERRANQIKELRAENDTAKIELAEKDLKGLSRKIGYIEKALWIGAAFGFYELANEINNPYTSEVSSQMSLGLGIMSTSLAIHFRQSKKLDDLLTNKIMGNPVEIDNKKVRKWQRTGRYSHLTGVSTLLTILGTGASAIALEYPLLTGVLGGIGAVCYYHNFIEGYSALYSSMGDFILGEKRKKK